MWQVVTQHVFHSATPLKLAWHEALYNRHLSWSASLGSTRCLLQWTSRTFKMFTSMDAPFFRTPTLIKWSAYILTYLHVLLFYFHVFLLFTVPYLFKWYCTFCLKMGENEDALALDMFSIRWFLSGLTSSGWSFRNEDFFLSKCAVSLS